MASSTTPDSHNLRYILFLIDNNHKQHDGEIFCSLKDAKESAAFAIKYEYCKKYIIGIFLLDANAERMLITHIETFGFSGDKKDPNQLELFK